jgi:hypothetical protein
MRDTAKRYIELTEGEITASVAGVRCLACADTKSSGQPFCPADFARLPLASRLALSEKPGFPESFRRALQHLVDLGPRPSRVGGRLWTFASLDELEAAGFRFIRITNCSVPRCWQKIAWLWTPRNSKMPVNVADCQPHRSTCLDPDYHLRRREQQRLQASARRATRKARRA